MKRLLTLAALATIVTVPALAQSTPMTELPANAQPGECYARVLVPATYETKTDRVLKHEGSEKIEIVPAKFEWVNEKVVTKEASDRLEIVPAEYKWVEEKLMTSPASQTIKEVPAKFEWAEEKVMVKPAQNVWKKGRGPIEKVDNATGDIMCMVEEPAVYKTIRKRVQTKPATSTKVDVPAQYKTIRKQVLAKPATTRKVAIPAVHTTVKVKKLVSPAQEKRVPVAAEYTTVTKKVKLTDGKMEWKPVLCQTNVSKELITSIQRSLKAAGHNPGPIDGLVGSQTLEALTAFQRSKGLASGALTNDTLQALKVRIPGR